MAAISDGHDVPPRRSHCWKEMPRFTSNTKFCHPAQHAPPFSSEERHGVLTSRTSFVMPLSMHRQSAAKSGMAPCRGSMLLACLLALVLPGAAQCPASWVTAPTSFRFSVSVSNDTALLAAMGDPQVDGILVDRDIYLGELQRKGHNRCSAAVAMASPRSPLRCAGPSWRNLSSPVLVTRNLTLYSIRLNTLNLNTVQNAVSIGDGVVLTLSGLLIQQAGGPSPLDPGQWRAAHACMDSCMGHSHGVTAKCQELAWAAVPWTCMHGLELLILRPFAWQSCIGQLLPHNVDALLLCCMQG